MPTTIYDASLITTRSRNKTIAQQVQQNNMLGNPIIVPQTGYGSYTAAEYLNGAITDFKKIGSGTFVNRACRCSVTSAADQPDPPQTYLFTVSGSGFSPGGGTISVSSPTNLFWGDGTSTLLIPEQMEYSHTYSTEGVYRINIENPEFLLELIANDNDDVYNISNIDLHMCSSLSEFGAGFTGLDSKTRLNNYEGIQLPQSCKILLLNYGTMTFSDIISQGDNLEVLGLYNISNITSLTTSGFVQLVSLNCFNLPITYINVSNTPKLEFLSCSNTTISTLSGITDTQLSQLFCVYCNLGTSAIQAITGDLITNGIYNGILNIVGNPYDQNDAQIIANIETLTTTYSWEVTT